METITPIDRLSAAPEIFGCNMYVRLSTIDDMRGNPFDDNLIFTHADITFTATLTDDESAWDVLATTNMDDHRTPHKFRVVLSDTEKNLLSARYEYGKARRLAGLE